MSNRPADRAPPDGVERHSIRLPWPRRPVADDGGAAQAAGEILGVIAADLGSEAAPSCAAWVSELLRNGGTAWHSITTPAEPVTLTLTLLEDGERECHALLSVARGSGEANWADRMAAARLDAMITTAGALCHAVNNTLTALLGNAEMLLETAGLPEDATLSAQLILRAGERLDGLTRQTLQLGRARHPGPGRCDPAAQLNRLAESLAKAEARGSRLEVSVASDLGSLLVEPAALDAAASHLLRNALAAGGRVALRAEREAVPAWPGFAWLRLTVEDDGPGLPPAELAFPGGGFLTSGRSGGRHPLGLASVRAFATALGGSLQAGRGALGGASLTLRLPVLDAGGSLP